MAFKIAGSLGFKRRGEFPPTSSSTIMNSEISVPPRPGGRQGISAAAGGGQRDRGRPGPGLKRRRSPCEMLEYSRRDLPPGKGAFHMEFSHY